MYCSTAYLLAQCDRHFRCSHDHTHRRFHSMNRVRHESDHRSAVENTTGLDCIPSAGLCCSMGRLVLVPAPALAPREPALALVSAAASA
jgi:hypothetical protein